MNIGRFAIKLQPTKVITRGMQPEGHDVGAGCLSIQYGNSSFNTSGIRWYLRIFRDEN